MVSSLVLPGVEVVACLTRGCVNIQKSRSRSARLIRAVVLCAILLLAAQPSFGASYDTSVNNLQISAQKGDAVAQTKLGLMYYTGQGVPKNYQQAFYWYRKAAQQGYAAAQINLGAMYALGRGVPQDYKQALYWYRKAAEQGYADAQFNVGLMYALGLGVVQDYTLAHMWFNLASARGHTNASKFRDKIATIMSPYQLAEAQRLARNWHPKKLQKKTASYLTKSPSPSLVIQIQKGLAQLGYYPGKTDGIAGIKTRAAIRTFQLKYGLKVDGKPSAKLLAAIRVALKSSAASVKKLECVATGTGFVVSPQGHVLTNYHVIKGARQIKALGVKGALRLVASDPYNDLALLKLPFTPKEIVRFRAPSQKVRLGEAVVVMGYPLHGLLTTEINVTTGIVSALAGPGDDKRLLQITAPVQGGNSGGPLLDKSGLVIGVVVAKLNALRLAALTGEIPQNVNFAIHGAMARSFLETQGVTYLKATSTKELKTEDLVNALAKAVFLIENWQ